MTDRTPIERATRALTATLRHHGVEMHPDDVRGLVHDVLAAIREPSEAMVEAMSPSDDLPWWWEAKVAVAYQRAIDALLAEKA